MIHTSTSLDTLKRHPVFLPVCFVVAVLAFFLAVPGRASAARITVNSLDDTVTADDNCTLREAINNANADFRQTTSGECAVGEGQGFPQDIIEFTGFGTIKLRSTLPPIASAHGLIIDGGIACLDAGFPERFCRERITISGGGTVRVFVVNRLAQLTLRNLTVSRGNNQGDGGGIFNSGELTISNSTFSDNRARNGGGIFNAVGGVTITNSTFSRNQANPGRGGVIETRMGSFTQFGGLMITGSTFSDNNAIGDGGAIVITAGVPPCEVNITNSTFFNNLSQDGVGGAIHNTCSLNITSSTFSNNSRADGSSSIATVLRPVTLRNTILETILLFQQCQGTIIDGGYNIEDGTTCGFSETNNSMPNTRALLDTARLQNNGGPTETIALCTEAGAPSAGCPGRSPAISAISIGVNGCITDIPTDQRGFPRAGLGPELDTSCDIGAFEFLVTTGCTVNDVPNQLCQGTSGPDRIIGTTGKDVIHGLGGDDDVDGGDGDDILFGGESNDRLVGGNANDQLFGQAGDDDLRGDAGNDLLEGGPGADMLDSGNGTDDCISDAEDPSVLCSFLTRK